MGLYPPVPSRIPHTKGRIIDNRNRVTLPDEVRRALDVAPGDFVAFDIIGTRVTIVPLDLVRRSK